MVRLTKDMGFKPLDSNKYILINKTIRVVILIYIYNIYVIALIKEAIIEV